MDRMIRLAWLLDFYGAMLTDRQRYLLAQHLNEDYSAAEIAAFEGVSRQAVYDALSKAEGQLELFEQRLGLLERYQGVRREAGEALALLERGEVEAAGQRLRALAGL